MQWGISPLTMPPKVIVNGFSAGGAVLLLNPQNDSALQYVSGALTPNVWKELLSVSGAGIIEFCSVFKGGTTSRTIGVKLTIDGVDAFSAVADADATAMNGLVVIGVKSTTSVWQDGTPAPFNTSLSVSVQSSVDQVIYLQAKYRTV